MKERPIIMSAESVRAILEGRKTQTRRVVKPQPTLNGHFWELGGAGWSDNITQVTPMPGHSLYYACPFGHDGDRLWVRETFQPNPEAGMTYPEVSVPPSAVCYAVDYSGQEVMDMRPWRSPIHMPRFASRITLEITNVRVERLQEISHAHADILAEGITECPGREKYNEDCDCIILTFEKLWNSINAARGFGWDVNPWVWVIEFGRVEATHEPI